METKSNTMYSQESIFKYFKYTNALLLNIFAFSFAFNLSTY